MPDLVTISALAEDTGEKARTLQHWSDVGILRPVPHSHHQGRGFYREFPAEPLFGERIWALLASSFAKLRIPLGEIKIVTDELRIQTASDRYKSRRSFEASPFYRAIRGDGEVILLASLARPGSELDMRLKFLAPITPDMLEQHPQKATYPHATTELGETLRFLHENPQALILNLTSIFAPLRV